MLFIVVLCETGRVRVRVRVSESESESKDGVILHVARCLVIFI